MYNIIVLRYQKKFDLTSPIYKYVRCFGVYKIITYISGSNPDIFNLESGIG
jgi:hypothetical protein